MILRYGFGNRTKQLFMSEFDYTCFILRLEVPKLRVSDAFFYNIYVFLEFQPETISSYRARALVKIN